MATTLICNSFICGYFGVLLGGYRVVPTHPVVPPIISSTISTHEDHPVTAVSTVPPPSLSRPSHNMHPVPHSHSTTHGDQQFHAWPKAPRRLGFTNWRGCQRTKIKLFQVYGSFSKKMERKNISYTPRLYNSPRVNIFHQNYTCSPSIIIQGNFHLSKHLRERFYRYFGNKWRESPRTVLNYFLWRITSFMFELL